MGYKITILSEFIEVRLDGAFGKETALLAATMLMELKEYKALNTVWDFTNAYMDLSVAEFSEIVTYLSEIIPGDIIKNKSAFVVNSDFEKSMGNLYVTRSNQLSLNYSIFKSRDAAENWVRQ